MCWQFSCTGEPVYLVVPASGRYRITAFGANGSSSATGCRGGRGAEMGGVFTLLKGDRLVISVGRAGLATSEGGGGSTVALDEGDARVPLVIAGGGGGGGVGLPGGDGSPQRFQPDEGNYAEADGRPGEIAGGHGGCSYLDDSMLPSIYTVQIRGGNVEDPAGHGLVRIVGSTGGGAA